jgi:amino acid transporter
MKVGIMKVSFREYSRFFYLVVFAVSAVFLLITLNDLIFRDSSLIISGFSLLFTGPWEYWIFVIAVIFTFYFLYLFIKSVRDYSRFTSIIEGNSKQNLAKNLPDMKRIAKQLGKKYQDELKEAMDKWKLK